MWASHAEQATVSVTDFGGGGPNVPGILVNWEGEGANIKILIVNDPRQPFQTVKWFPKQHIHKLSQVNDANEETLPPQAPLVSVFDWKRSAYVPGMVVQWYDSGADVKLLLDDVQTFPVQWYPYTGIHELQQPVTDFDDTPLHKLLQPAVDTSRLSWHAPGVAVSVQAPAPFAIVDHADDCCSGRPESVPASASSDIRTQALEAELETARAELEAAHARVKELDGQLRRSETVAFPGGASGGGRHVVRVIAPFQSDSEGYLSATEGEVLVAVATDGEWHYGFPWDGGGWFQSQHVSPVP